MMDHNLYYAADQSWSKLHKAMLPYCHWESCNSGKTRTASVNPGMSQNPVVPTQFYSERNFDVGAKVRYTSLSVRNLHIIVAAWIKSLRKTTYFAECYMFAWVYEKLEAKGLTPIKFKHNETIGYQFAEGFDIDTCLKDIATEWEAEVKTLGFTVDVLDFTID